MTIRASGWSRTICSTASIPSIFGIVMSINTMSGCVFAVFRDGPRFRRPLRRQSPRQRLAPSCTSSCVRRQNRPPQESEPLVLSSQVRGLKLHDDFPPPPFRLIVVPPRGVSRSRRVGTGPRAVVRAQSLLKCWGSDSSGTIRPAYPASIAARGHAVHHARVHALRDGSRRPLPARRGHASGPAPRRRPYPS